MKNDLVRRIDAQYAFVEQCNCDCEHCNHRKTYPDGDARCSLVDDLPAVDAEPVKHGIWEEEPHVWRCSECHKWLMVEDGDADMNFCTHCGARMDGRGKQ